MRHIGIFLGLVVIGSVAWYWFARLLSIYVMLRRQTPRVPLPLDEQQDGVVFRGGSGGAARPVRLAVAVLALVTSYAVVVAGAYFLSSVLAGLL